MITLNIKYEDGSHYWTEYFNEMDRCEKWLAEEKTRPYWNEKFTVEIIEEKPKEKSEKEKAEEAAKIEAKKSRKAALKKLAGKNLSAEEIQQAVALILAELVD